MSKLFVEMFGRGKKGFVIDKISEDSFYENLLLGLTSVLKTCRFVSHINLERHPPATLDEVTLWESSNCLTLPEDLRNFYLSTNGFTFTYKFQYDKSEEENFVLAGIEINPLSKLEMVATTETMYLTEGGIKILAPYSRIFILSKLEDSCVVLAQFNPSRPPNIWLYYQMRTFYFLCEDFVTYLRMALAHVCVPEWQFSVLKATLPEWSSEMIHILAPGVFDRCSHETKSDLNVIDPSVWERDPDVEGHDGVGSVCGKRKSPRGKQKKINNGV